LFSAICSFHMAQVKIYVTKNGTSTLVRTLPESLLSKCSRTIRNLLENQHGLEKEVHFTGISPAPLDFVLTEILKNGTKTYIRVHKEPLERAVAIFQAIEALAVEPPQPQVDGFIVQHIAHNQITPQGMVAVHLAYESRKETSKAWPTMVHQMSWDFTNGHYEADDAAALQNAADPYPTLLAAVDAKIKYLEQRRENFGEASARFGGQESGHSRGRQGSGPGRGGRQGRTRRGIRGADSGAKQRWYEEVHGMRVASEATVQWALRSKPGSYYLGPPKKELKKQNRAPEQEQPEELKEEE